MDHIADRAAELADSLRFDPRAGEIRLKDYRMVLTSACALGALRRELIETLGVPGARGAMKRFGHAAGLADGVALAELFPDASRAEHHDLGPALHGLEGIAKVVPIPERTRVDPERGELHVEAFWEGSYEAEQHLELFGPSDEPVCWTLVGYATGHSSSAAGDRTVVVETQCRAMGAERCRFVLDYACNLPDEAAREEPDYERHHLPDVLQDLLDRVKRQSRSLRESRRTITRLESELSRHRPPNALIGDGPKFREVLATARTVAPVDATVLLLGESGTGKEGLARFLHEQSLRSAEPFVAVNCSSLPETLQEAELFGYAKGAFTGASAATPGLFEAAHRGTLLLDEVGDLSPSAQTKILRALEEREIKRLGETRTRRVDVRVVAATHRDLRGMVDRGEFRADLFYRLSVIEITVPALRERGHDALLLAEHFLRERAEALARPVRSLSRAAKATIAAYGWPGNVRELRNAMERAAILSVGDEVGPNDLPPEVAGGAAAGAGSAEDAALRERLGQLRDEGARISAALEASAGSRVRAAELLGMSRTTLWRRMKQHGLLAPDHAG
ncbi:MAG: sigma-54-dependent Fis family transcriptional regulator [Planctomycetota bacterium]